MSGEWVQKALRGVEESGEHLATGECREEVMFVAFDNGGLCIPEVVAVEEDVVDGVAIAAMRTCGVIPGILSKAQGICGVKGVSCNDLEGGRLVGM